MAGTSRFLGTLLCSVTANSRIHSDGLGDIATRHPDLQAAFTQSGRLQHPQLEISSRSAIDVALDLIRSEPDKSITYIALGPLTDLSGMLKRDPVLVRERLGRVVCMGGAFDVPGNSTPVAECQMPPSPLDPVDRRLMFFQSTSLQIPTPFMMCSPPPYLIRVSLANVSFWSPSTSPHLMNCHSRFIKPKLTRSLRVRALLQIPQGSHHCYTLPAPSWKGQGRLCYLMARMRWNCMTPWPSGLLSRTHQERNRPANPPF